MQDTTSHLLTESQSQSTSRSPSIGPGSTRAKAHWRRLRLALKAIALFKHPEISIVLDIDQLACDVESSPYPRTNSKRSGFSRAVSEYRLLESLFSHIARGSAADLSEVDSLLRSDPARALNALSDSKSLVNHRSVNGKTLLHEAATQGNLPAVQLLLRHGADLYQKSDSDGELETPLQAACRWNHVHVAELLLSRYNWPKEDLKSAYRATRNPELRANITRVLGKAKHSCRCWG